MEMNSTANCLNQAAAITQIGVSETTTERWTSRLPEKYVTSQRKKETAGNSTDPYGPMFLDGLMGEAPNGKFQLAMGVPPARWMVFVRENPI